jgi:hypothetical protein
MEWPAAEGRWFRQVSFVKHSDGIEIRRTLFERSSIDSVSCGRRVKFVKVCDFEQFFAECFGMSKLRLVFDSDACLIQRPKSLWVLARQVE